MANNTWLRSNSGMGARNRFILRFSKLSKHLLRIDYVKFQCDSMNWIGTLVIVPNAKINERYFRCPYCSLRFVKRKLIQRDLLGFTSSAKTYSTVDYNDCMISNTTIADIQAEGILVSISQKLVPLLVNLNFLTFGQHVQCQPFARVVQQTS